MPLVSIPYFSYRDTTLGSKAQPYENPGHLKFERWAREYLQTRLQKDLSAFVLSADWRAMRESSLRAWRPLDAIDQQALANDILSSPYEIEKICSIGKERREATALISTPTFDARGTPICFDLKRILAGELAVEGYPYFKAIVFALALHEHLHHFGFWDKDNLIIRQFSDRAFFWLTNRLPPAHELRVMPNFRDLRNRYRNGIMPAFKSGEKAEIRLVCRAEKLKLNLTPALQNLGDQYVQWLENIRFRPSLLGENQIELISNANENPLRPMPHSARVSGYSGEGMWIIMGVNNTVAGTSIFDYIPENQEKSTFAGLLNWEKEGSKKFTIEIVLKPRRSQEHLASVWNEDYLVFAYLDCDEVSLN